MMQTWESTYANLPRELFSWVRIQPSPEPRLCLYNRALGEELGLPPDFPETEGRLLIGIPRNPDQVFLAQAYAGHQFGHFTNLGDGRAALLGEVCAPGGQRWDLQYKGSGPTPYSRQGDGKAALGPMLREYLIGEALHAQGIPSTRILALTATGETVLRSEPLRGALAVRAGHSHIRVGTFQYAAAAGGPELVKALADYTLRRHYPECRDSPRPYLAFFEAASRRQARMVARWMGTGFVHGVMNTDNMALSGQSMDFGPCAFLDDYNPGTVFSSIDRGGRYAYRNQPVMAQWNLARLAETLIPLLGESPEAGLEAAQAAVDLLPAVFLEEQARVWALKLGLDPVSAGSAELAGEYLVWLEKEGPDFTRAFRALADLASGRIPGPEAPLPGTRWLETWEAQDPTRRQSADLDLWNPLYIPRNYWVEEALAGAQEGNWDTFRNLERALKNPGTAQEGLEHLAGPGPEKIHITYCGT